MSSPMSDYKNPLMSGFSNIFEVYIELQNTTSRFFFWVKKKKKNKPSLGLTFGQVGWIRAMILNPIAKWTRMGQALARLDPPRTFLENRWKRNKQIIMVHLVIIYQMKTTPFSSNK